MPKLNFHLDTKQGLTTVDIAKFKERNSLLARVPSFTNRQLKALKLILCNVVKYQDAVMLYTRRHEKLLPEPHNPQQISNKTIYNVVDKLLQNGLVTTTKGDKWYTTDADSRKLSTFKATPKLLNIAESIEIKEEKIVELETKDIVEVKTKDVDEEEAKDKIICVKTKILGTRISKKVCYNPAKLKLDKERSREGLKELQNQPSSPRIPESGRTP